MNTSARIGLLTHFSALMGLAIAAVLIQTTIPSLKAQAQPIQVQADSWMPVNGDPADKDAGYAVDLLRTVFGAKDINYTNVSWDVALNNVRSGKIQAVIGATQSEAPTLVFPKESIGRVRACLWARKDSTFVYTDANSLKGLTIGVIQGYTYWPELDALIKSGAIKTVAFNPENGNALDDAINALLDKKIDLLPEAAVVMAYAAREKKLDLDADFSIKYDHPSSELYVAFVNNKDGEMLAAQWDETIPKLRKDGQLAAILAKYGLPDWVQ